MVDIDWKKTLLEMTQNHLRKKGINNAGQQVLTQKGTKRKLNKQLAAKKKNLKKGRY
tara:strand:- start:241 stop:411 length:171 start_codon:yes stop_codon:yes gene_type:complete